jgi:hypothetical protein
MEQGTSEIRVVVLGGSQSIDYGAARVLGGRPGQLRQNCGRRDI